MGTDLRVVVDTNVLISAALSLEGSSRKALDWVAEHATILSSGPAVQEFVSRMRRPKFEPYLNPEDREAYIEWIVRHTKPVEVTEQVQACRDPDDDKFLSLAVSGGADLIVSGDRDLRALHPFRGTPILAPDELLESGLVEK